MVVKTGNCFKDAQICIWPNTTGWAQTASRHISDTIEDSRNHLFDSYSLYVQLMDGHSSFYTGTKGFFGPRLNS